MGNIPEIMTPSAIAELRENAEVKQGLTSGIVTYARAWMTTNKALRGKSIYRVYSDIFRGSGKDNGNTTTLIEYIINDPANFERLYAVLNSDDATPIEDVTAKLVDDALMDDNMLLLVDTVYGDAN